MRLSPLAILLFSCLYIATGCKKDADPNIPVVTLSTENVTGKSDRDIEVTVDMTIPDGFKSLEITKGVNLKNDADYDPGSTTPADLGGGKFRYIFLYTLQRDEIEKLVGFNFKLTDNSGRVVEKDLTVNTIANPAEIVYSRNWKLVSKLRVTASPAVEEMDECGKDNIWKFKKDSTMDTNWGAPGCGFEGLNVYDKWTLSADEKTFTQSYFNLFDPSQRTDEVFNVRSITNDKLVMDIIFDLSWLGPPYTDKEQFVYTYERTL